MASRALQDLPSTNQSVAIRKKLRAFKQGMLRDLVLAVVVGVLLPGITVALPAAAGLPHSRSCAGGLRR
jgi:hypothetical protein